MYNRKSKLRYTSIKMCIRDRFKKSDRIDLTRDPAAMGRLKEEAEKAKKELSSAPSAQLNLPFIAVGKDGPHHLDIALSRPQFEMMTGDLLSRTCLLYTSKMTTMATPRTCLRICGLMMPILERMMVISGISNTQPKMMNMVRQRLRCV